MEGLTLTPISDSYSQLHRRLPKLVPSHRRERGLCRNLEPAEPTTLESTWSRSEIFCRTHLHDIF